MLWFFSDIVWIYSNCITGFFLPVDFADMRRENNLMNENQNWSKNGEWSVLFLSHLSRLFAWTQIICNCSSTILWGPCSEWVARNCKKMFFVRVWNACNFFAEELHLRKALINWQVVSTPPTFIEFWFFMTTLTFPEKTFCNSNQTRNFLHETIICLWTRRWNGS